MKYILVIWILAGDTGLPPIKMEVDGPKGCVDAIVNIVTHAPQWFIPKKHMMTLCQPADIVQNGNTKTY